jgi:pyruvyl transferase EpsO
VRAVAPYGRSDLAVVRRALGDDGIVLLSAGGHLTDRWPDMLEGVSSTIAGLPGHRVVVLPQSVHFDDPRSAAALAATVAAHGAVRILVRDAASITRAADAGLAEVELCPDFAFLDLGLERRATSVRAGTPPLVIRRADREAEDAAAAISARGNDADWISPRSGWRAGAWAGARTSWRALAHVAPQIAQDPRWGGRLVDAQARLSVARGVSIIGSAGIVVTDRLHVAILGTMLGRDVIAVDSGTGKVHDVLSTWLDVDDRVQLVDSWSGAGEQAVATLR